MTNETERSILWLMEACIPTPAPLDWLLPEPQLTGLNMSLIQEVEGTSRLISVVDMALRLELIQVFRVEALGRNEVKWPVADYKNVDVDLTVTGGKWWEERAKPDWDKFIDGSWTASSTTELRCASKEQLLQWLENYVLFSGERPIPSTIVWQEARPWRVTNWKELPLCYQVTYRYERDPKAMMIPPPLGLYEWKLSLERWYRTVQPQLSAAETWRRPFDRTDPSRS